MNAEHLKLIKKYFLVGIDESIKYIFQVPITKDYFELLFNSFKEDILSKWQGYVLYPLKVNELNNYKIELYNWLKKTKQIK